MIFRKMGNIFQKKLNFEKCFFDEDSSVEARKGSCDRVLPSDFGISVLDRFWVSKNAPIGAQRLKTIYIILIFRTESESGLKSPGLPVKNPFLQENRCGGR